MRRALHLLPAALLALLAVSASADPAGFAFLKVPAGARASGLGGAYASVADGLEGVFWNPAALEGVKGLQIVGSHYEYLEQLRHDQFAVGGRMFGGGMAASLRALYSEPIEQRDELGNLIGTFGTYDLEFGLGYGRSIASGVRVGGTAQLVRERIAELTAMTWAFGLGGTWEPAHVSGLRLSLGTQNLGPAAHYQIDGSPGGPVRLPTSVQAGASYGRALISGMRVLGALESRLSAGEREVTMLGAELSHPSGAAVRAGLRLGDTESRLGFGAGWMLQGLRLDYAFVPFRLDLGDTHRFSLSAQF
jgi:hypothetical protein